MVHRKHITISAKRLSGTMMRLDAAQDGKIYKAEPAESNIVHMPKGLAEEWAANGYVKGLIVESKQPHQLEVSLELEQGFYYHVQVPAQAGGEHEMIEFYVSAAGIDPTSVRWQPIDPVTHKSMRDEVVQTCVIATPDRLELVGFEFEFNFTELTTSSKEWQLNLGRGGKGGTAISSKERLMPGLFRLDCPISFYDAAIYFRVDGKGRIWTTDVRRHPVDIHPNIVEMVPVGDDPGKLTAHGVPVTIDARDLAQEANGAYAEFIIDRAEQYQGSVSIVAALRLLPGLHHFYATNSADPNRAPMSFTFAVSHQGDVFAPTAADPVRFKWDKPL